MKTNPKYDISKLSVNKLNNTTQYTFVDYQYLSLSWMNVREKFATLLGYFDWKD